MAMEAVETVNMPLYVLALEYSVRVDDDQRRPR